MNRQLKRGNMPTTFPYENLMIVPLIVYFSVTLEEFGLISMIYCYLDLDLF